MDKRPNKALRLTANPLRGLSAAELGRSCGRAAFVDFDSKADIAPSVRVGSQVAVEQPRMDFIA